MNLHNHYPNTLVNILDRQEFLRRLYLDLTNPYLFLVQLCQEFHRHLCPMGSSRHLDYSEGWFRRDILGSLLHPHCRYRNYSIGWCNYQATYFHFQYHISMDNQ